MRMYSLRPSPYACRESAYIRKRAISLGESVIPRMMSLSSIDSLGSQQARRHQGFHLVHDSSSEHSPALAACSPGQCRSRELPRPVPLGDQDASNDYQPKIRGPAVKVVRSTTAQLNLATFTHAAAASRPAPAGLTVLQIMWLTSIGRAI